MFAIKPWGKEGGVEEVEEGRCPIFSLQRKSPVFSLLNTAEADGEISQRKFSPKSLLQPEGPITVLSLLVRRGEFGPCVPPLAGQCVGMEGPCTALQAAPSPHPLKAIPHIPSRGFWRGAGSSRHIGSDTGDSARSHDLCFPPLAQ